MKTLLQMALVFSLSISFISKSFGQGSPGTGGFFEKWPIAVAENNDAYLKTLSESDQKKYRELHQSVEKNIIAVANQTKNKECLQHDAVIPNLVALHAILTKGETIKRLLNMNSHQSICSDEATRKFHCQFSWIQRFRFKQTVNNKLFGTYLQHAYKLEGEELKTLVDFYKELAKK